jgi:AraC family transcriptional regulator
VVVPAKTSHSASWDENASFTVLAIEPKFLARIAHEFINPDRVEILPCFAQPDPVIYEIVSKLNSKLELDEEVDHMYVDSATTFLATHLMVSTKLSLDEIAIQTDFSTHSYLSGMFRKYRSISPDQYRKKIRQ